MIQVSVFCSCLIKLGLEARLLIHFLIVTCFTTLLVVALAAPLKHVRDLNPVHDIAFDLYRCSVFVVQSFDRSLLVFCVL